MNNPRYKVGDYVVLNKVFTDTYGFNDLYADGSVLQITEAVKSRGLSYQAEPPKFLGDFGWVFIGDEYIDHEATDKLNKE